MMWMFSYGWMPWMALMALYWLISLIFVVWALVDVANREKDAGYKFIWAFMAILLGLLGVLLYYLLEKMTERGMVKAPLS